MENKNWLETLSPILENYQVKPYYVEDSGSVQKIYSNKGTFALKKISPNIGTDFIRHVHLLYQKGYNRIVPIYPTMDGRYAVLHDKELYYLMPWMSNEIKEDREHKNQQLFRELARLHTLSAKEIEVSKEERTEHFEKSLNQLEKHQEFLDGFIDECEKRTYMSPFELCYCLYYNDISMALNFSKRKLEEWYEKTKDSEKARMVIIHGKLSTEHFLYDERGYGYFINFENARYGSPIQDLLPYLSRALDTNPKPKDDAIDWVLHYFKYFPYRADEKLLFYSYLAHPVPMIQVIETYYRKLRSSRNELKFVKELQHRFWHLKNCEYVVMRMNEIDVHEQQAKEGAQQQ